MSVERIELGQVKHTKIEVEEVPCRTVTIRDEAHAKANHYIKQSREYFPMKSYSFTSTVPTS